MEKITLDIYDIDTTDTIQRRVTAQQNSSLKYMYFIPFSLNNPSNPLLLQSSQSSSITIEFTNILHLIQSQTDIVINKDVLKVITSLIESDPLIKLTLEDIIKTWVSFLDITHISKTIPKAMLTTIIEDEIQKILNHDKFNFELFMRHEADTYKRAIIQDTDSNRRISQRETKVATEFSSIIPVKTTDYEIDNISYVLFLNIPNNTSLAEIFNMIVLNEHIPYCVYNNYHKILKTFIPPTTWNDLSSDDFISLMVSQRKGDIAKEADYTQVIIGYQDDAIGALLKYTTSVYNISQAELSARFLSCLPNINTTSQIESKIIATTNIPNNDIDFDILADLIMNNQLFSHFLVTNESAKATKVQHFIYFKHPIYTDITASVARRIYTKPTSNIFTQNTPYIKIKARGQNMAAITTFREVIAKLFNVYITEKPSIISFYKQYIPDFGSQLPIDITEEKEHRLKDIEPELFTGDISRTCKVLPRIVSEEEALQKGEGKYMQFPKTPEEGTQHYYICDDDKLVPSLKDNKLSKKYKYLPCCHESHHPIYLEYYKGIAHKKSTLAQSHIIKTKKFAGHNKVAVLPDNLTYLLSLFDGYTNINFGRKGVHDTKSSFLECIWMALKIGPYANSDNITQEDMEKALLTERQTVLASLIKTTGVSGQETYNMTQEDILNKLTNPAINLEPSLFIRLLEAQYNCKIFVFTRTEEDAMIMIPRYSQAYLAWELNPNTRTVLIFKHNGAESDYAQFDRCELIMHWSEKHTMHNVLSFNSSQSLIEYIHNIFIMSMNNYTKAGRILPFKHPSDLFLSIIQSQSLDTFGKCRLITVQYENELINLYTSFMPPLKIPVQKSIQHHLPSLKTVLKLLAHLKLVPISQTVINNKTREISYFLGNVSITIPIKETSKIPEAIPVRPNNSLINSLIIPFIGENSIITNYNKNKKIARYLTEYTLWFFSLSLEEELTDDAIHNFYTQKITIDPSQQYITTPKSFTLNCDFFRDNRLVLRDQETTQRLLYILKLACANTPDKIINYKYNTEVKNFFIDITDFTDHSHQILLYGTDSLTKWYDEMTLKRTLHFECNKNNEPYFFDYDSQIYLAQPSLSFNDAKNTGIFWDLFKYNPINEPELLSKVPLVSKGTSLELIKMDCGTKISTIIDFSMDTTNTETQKIIHTSESDIYTSLLKV
mgnify:CR=1 FL=1